jgi:hypothetical protein
MNFTYPKKKKKDPFGGLKESSDEEGRRVRERENQPKIHIFRLDLSLYPARDLAGRGFRPDAVEDPTFRFRSDLSDVIDSVSRSHRPVFVARLSRRPEREREREREREGDEVERDLFFLRERDLVLSFKKKKKKIRQFQFFPDSFP